MQDILNQKLFADWKYRSLDWNTAILVEAAELIDHTAWKWWKKGATSALAQARMEAVDIWHFLLSRIGELRSPQELEELAADASVFFEGPAPLTTEPEAKVVATRAKALVSGLLSLNSDRVVLQYFAYLLGSLGMSFNDLYRLYIGKGVLNQFRWANGYGSTYAKDWLGEEDNEYLTRAMGELDPSSDTFAQGLMSRLEGRYAEVVAASAGSIA